MKKTVLTPRDELNKKITEAAACCGGYAGGILKLPNEKKKSRAPIISLISTGVAACILLTVLLAPKIFKEPTPSYNLPVGDELFETYEFNNNNGIASSNRLTMDYDNLELFIEQADLVVVGYPVNTFTSDPHAYYSRSGEFVDVNGDWYTLDTVREIKVLDVLKGEIDTESINLQVSEVAIWDENGNFEIKELDAYYFIQKQNVKYIFLLNEGKATYNGEKTYGSYLGCINVDGLHKSSLKHIDGGAMLKLIETYPDIFEKYDRSDEVEYEPDEAEHYAISGMRYFNNEQDAYGYSDLVVVASPKNDIKEDGRVSFDGKVLETDDEVGQYHRDQVFTLRDMSVLNVIKGDKDITDIYIANACHYYYDKHSRSRELWHSTYTPYEDPITKKDAVYLYYLKRDETLGENVYRLAGRQCIVNLDGTDQIGGLYRYTAKRIYEIFIRNTDVFKEYKKEG